MHNGDLVDVGVERWEFSGFQGGDMGILVDGDYFFETNGNKL